MFCGFNLNMGKEFFEDSKDYRAFSQFRFKGNECLKADTDKLKEHVLKSKLDGTGLRADWFDDVQADIFISHTQGDYDLALALSGWLSEKFKLKCFVGSTIWNCSEHLTIKLNDRFSVKEKQGSIPTYYYKNANIVAQYVNSMLSTAVQKMIDKTECVVLLNEQNFVQNLQRDSALNKSFSPWIFPEVVCAETIRKKSLQEYREDKKDYDVLTNKLVELKSDNLKNWLEMFEDEMYVVQSKPIPLDVLYKSEGIILSEISPKKIEEKIEETVETIIEDEYFDFVANESEIDFI